MAWRSALQRLSHPRVTDPQSADKQIPAVRKVEQILDESLARLAETFTLARQRR